MAGGGAAGAAAEAQASACRGVDRPAQRLRAEWPNHVWAFDFQFDQTADRRAMKLLNIVDEFTREALVMLVERGIDADPSWRCWSGWSPSGARRSYLRCDNGPR